MRLLNVAVATSVLVAVSSAPVGDIYPTAAERVVPDPARDESKSIVDAYNAKREKFGLVYDPIKARALRKRKLAKKADILAKGDSSIRPSSSSSSHEHEIFPNGGEVGREGGRGGYDGTSGKKSALTPAERSHAD